MGSSYFLKNRKSLFWYWTTQFLIKIFIKIYCISVDQTLCFTYTLIYWNHHESPSTRLWTQITLVFKRELPIFFCYNICGIWRIFSSRLYILRQMNLFSQQNYYISESVSYNKRFSRNETTITLIISYYDNDQ